MSVNKDIIITTETEITEDLMPLNVELVLIGGMDPVATVLELKEMCRRTDILSFEPAKPYECFHRFVKKV